MKVAVAGGAGFIGSHVCDVLLEAGHEVFVIDDLSSGTRENLDCRIPLHVLDVRSAEAARLIRHERPEALMLLAAQMDVRRSVEDPRFDADVNVGGLLNLVEAGARNGLRRVVFSSTGGAIYGEQDYFPAAESHPTRPCSPYGVSKAAGELYLGYYRQQHGLSYVALRYANVYGPRQSSKGEAGVVAIFCGKLLGDLACTIYGTGEQTRDYVYVGDVARANLAALSCEHVGPVNIGTGVETDVLHLHRKLATISGRGKPPLFAPSRPGEQHRSSVDNGLAQRVLGWRPEVNIDQGLTRTYTYFEKRALRSGTLPVSYSVPQ